MKSKFNIFKKFSLTFGNFTVYIPNYKYKSIDFEIETDPKNPGCKFKSYFYKRNLTDLNADLFPYMAESGHANYSRYVLDNCVLDWDKTTSKFKFFLLCLFSTLLAFPILIFYWFNSELWYTWTLYTGLGIVGKLIFGYISFFWIYIYLNILFYLIFIHFIGFRVWLVKLALKYEKFFHSILVLSNEVYYRTLLLKLIFHIISFIRGLFTVIFYGEYQPYLRFNISIMLAVHSLIRVFYDDQFASYIDFLEKEAGGITYEEAKVDASKDSKSPKDFILFRRFRFPDFFERWSNCFNYTMLYSKRSMKQFSVNPSQVGYLETFFALLSLVFIYFPLVLIFKPILFIHRNLFSVKLFIISIISGLNAIYLLDISTYKKALNSGFEYRFNLFKLFVYRWSFLIVVAQILGIERLFVIFLLAILYELLFLTMSAYDTHKFFINEKPENFQTFFLKIKCFIVSFWLEFFVHQLHEIMSNRKFFQLYSQLTNTSKENATLSEIYCFLVKKAIKENAQVRSVLVKLNILKYLPEDEISAFHNLKFINMSKSEDDRLFETRENYRYCIDLNFFSLVLKNFTFTNIVRDSHSHQTRYSEISPLPYNVLYGVQAMSQNTSYHPNNSFFYRFEGIKAPKIFVFGPEDEDTYEYAAMEPFQALTQSWIACNWKLAFYSYLQTAALFRNPEELVYGHVSEKDRWATEGTTKKGALLPDSLDELPQKFCCWSIARKGCETPEKWIRLSLFLRAILQKLEDIINGRPPIKLWKVLFILIDINPSFFWHELIDLDFDWFNERGVRLKKKEKKNDEKI